MQTQASEGFIPFLDHKTWYRMVGEEETQGKLPLICLHGGPGCPHDYLEPLEAVASSGRRVVLYDQLGCGNSDLPRDLGIYTVALFVEELNTVRQALGLTKIHLLGHSWGGMLAMEYALTQPDGLGSLILADTGASIPQWEAETRRLVDELPQEVQQAIRSHETAGTTDSPEYQEACREFSRRHLGRRLDPRPDCLMRASSKFGEDVYAYMWGPSEWNVTGTLKDWDVTSRLGEIRVPTLVLSGRFDEATPAIAETLLRGIPGSEGVILENSGHMAHLEEPVRFLELLTDFLDRVEVES